MSQDCFSHCKGCAWLRKSGHCQAFQRRRRPIWRDEEDRVCLGYADIRRKMRVEREMQEYADLKNDAWNARRAAGG